MYDYALGYEFVLQPRKKHNKSQTKEKMQHSSTNCIYAVNVMSNTEVHVIYDNNWCLHFYLQLYITYIYIYICWLFALLWWPFVHIPFLTRFIKESGECAKCYSRKVHMMIMKQCSNGPFLQWFMILIRLIMSCSYIWMSLWKFNIHLLYVIRFCGKCKINDTQYLWELYKWGAGCHINVRMNFHFIPSQGNTLIKQTNKVLFSWSSVNNIAKL